MKSKRPLFVVHYQNMSVNARGNQILTDIGAEVLAKSKATNGANLKAVFEKMDETRNERLN